MAPVLVDEALKEGPLSLELIIAIVGGSGMCSQPACCEIRYSCRIRSVVRRDRTRVLPRRSQEMQRPAVRVRFQARSRLRALSRIADSFG